MYKNILQLLENSAKNFPDKPAFSDMDGAYSYKEAVANARALGSYLSEFNETHRAVAVLQDKSKEMLVSFMGVVYSGNFYIPIDTGMPDERIEKIFNTVNPIAIITDNEHLNKAERICGKTKILTYDECINAKTDEEKLLAIRSRAIDTDPVYALFTSGSTGMPKGVVCCHRSVIDYADWLVETFGFNEHTIFGSQTPFYFSMSVLDIYATIKSGALLHVIPKELFAFPGKLLKHMNDMKINSIYWVPTALCIIANLKALDKVELPYLKNILFAGEAMPTKQLNIWRKHIPDALYANLFGPTEITDIGLYYIVDREFSDDEALPIGKTCDNVDAIILNDDGLSAKDGEIGELCIRGSFLSLGYYDDPEKTKEVFIQNPINPHYPETIYRTGDLVSVNDRGEFMYHGRKDFQIKHRGHRIELGEIENAAGSIAGIDMCACVYDMNKEKIVLFYQGNEVDNKEIRNSLSGNVPPYMIPGKYVKLEKMPINDNGKVDRKRLTALL